MLIGSVTREHKKLMQLQRGEDSTEADRVLRRKMIADLTPGLLTSLSLEGCVLDSRDLRFLSDFLGVHGATLTKLNFGLWNYRKMSENFLPLLKLVNKVSHSQQKNHRNIFTFFFSSLQLTYLSVHMSGKVDNRPSRRVPPKHLRELCSRVRADLPELCALHLPDFNLDQRGLFVDVINELVPRSCITEVTAPERVTRNMPGGGATLPFVGDLDRLGPNSK